VRGQKPRFSCRIRMQRILGQSSNVCCLWYALVLHSGDEWSGSGPDAVCIAELASSRNATHARISCMLYFSPGRPPQFPSTLGRTAKSISCPSPAIKSLGEFLPRVVGSKACKRLQKLYGGCGVVGWYVFAECKVAGGTMPYPTIVILYAADVRVGGSLSHMAAPACCQGVVCYCRGMQF
jgi:hypothetical protein